MKRKVSLKDIAQKVGVSTALVSYVLNGQEKQKRVGEEIAQKIKQAAKELNYQPNQIAKSLKSGKTHTLGLIVADIANPFSANIARIIEDEAKQHKYNVVFGSSDENAEKAWDLIKVLLNRQIDGFIIALAENAEEQIQYLKEHHIPFVLIDRYFPEVQASYVALDNFKAAYDGVEHLIRKGYKRIGMINFESGLFHLQERTRAYHQALQDFNLSAEPGWYREVNEDRLKDDMEQHLQQLLLSEEPVEALFLASNKIAINGLKFINERKLRVPEDVAIIGFDETDAYDLFYCPVTHIRQPMAEIGRNAVQALLKLIDGDDTQTQLNLEATLVVKSSC
ncbi:LacI family transcriptional regulator [Pontibacter qinzhouensis]|uniref:LacI family transcriptional regulator n=1 Tax=Pontibacter qinzhouensis TaxID=2603253 RepID=A0A5C8K9K3_9BACT|nr:substrate-binding domain-containing protein [Pontibacter qinzhouensis]TXK48063.1 LacI family transcriptional regulator [Pontibacter qinzhouensis]